jgi:hypothetical protein
VEQDNVVQQDAVMRGSTVPAQVLKEPDRIARLEKFVEKVKRQVHSQAGRIEVPSPAHRLGQTIHSSHIAGIIQRPHSSSLVEPRSAVDKRSPEARIQIQNGSPCRSIKNLTRTLDTSCFSM